MAPPETTRRLATILAADVVGYSRLMAEDEEATVRTLRAHREIIDRLIARHEGRIFHTAGDSVIAEFGSAVEAVRCATTIQDELRVRNAELPEDRRMLLRIGINIGDVIVDGDNLLGDGVNVAARLEGIAQPGGVCISGGTFDQVKNKLSIGFEDLGPQTVKNIPEPVAAFRITGAPVTVSAAATATATDTERGGIPASAVLGGIVLIAALAAGAWLVRAPDATSPPQAPHVEVAPSPPPPAAPAPDSKPATGVATTPVAPRPEPEPRPEPPEPKTGATTRDLSADAIAQLMTGLTINGTRQKDGQPFTIELYAAGNAAYSFPRSGAGAGTTFRATGSWRVADGLFCMRFQGFNEGQEACPVFVRDGERISAQRPSGEPLDWRVSRTAADSAITPSDAARSSDDLRAAEITALVTGAALHGTRQRDGKAFTIELQQGGTAHFSLERGAGKPPFVETGRWWSEDYRFCMQFATALKGKMSCPRILLSAGDRLALTRGDGTPLPWTLQR